MGLHSTEENGNAAQRARCSPSARHHIIIVHLCHFRRHPTQPALMDPPISSHMFLSVYFNLVASMSPGRDRKVNFCSLTNNETAYIAECRNINEYKCGFNLSIVFCKSLFISTNIKPNNFTCTAPSINLPTVNILIQLLRDRKGDQRGGEWEPIKISCNRKDRLSSEVHTQP